MSYGYEVLESTRGGQPVLCPETVAANLADYIIGYDLNSYRYTATSPFGLRYIHDKTRSERDRLANLDFDSLNEEVEQALLNHHSEDALAIHKSWRLLNRVHRFAANRNHDEPDTLMRTILDENGYRAYVADNSVDSAPVCRLVKWSRINETFRLGTGLILSRLADLPDSETIVMTEPQLYGYQNAVTTQIGRIEVTHWADQSANGERSMDTYAFQRSA